MNVMRAAVQGENRLKSMPNNTVIMVSFAACFALALGTTTLGSRAILAPNARALIEDTTMVLERIGNTPKHRNGLSVLFAKHIRRIMLNSLLQPTEDQQVYQSSANSNPNTLKRERNAQYTSPHGNADPTGTTTDPYVFDMTDDQILEAINNASASQELFQLDETMFVDWLDWPNVT